MDYESDGLHAASAEQFTNFNFAQAVAKILDNVGFSATTDEALELLTSMMRRYFEDLCQRIAANKDHCGRQFPSIGDVHMAFKMQHVSLTELGDYLRQVLSLPIPPKIPEYPVKKFDSSDVEQFQTRIFHADPFMDELPSLEEIEEKYGKKKQEDQEEMQISTTSDDQINKMEMSETENAIATIEEDPKMAFDSWTIPNNTELFNFSGFSAKDLGFDVDLYSRKFVKSDHKKSKSNGIPKIPNTSNLFNRHVPGSAGSIALKVDGLNKLVDKIKKRKHRDKDRKKDKHEKKHREAAPTLTPAISLPVPEPDSGIGDSLKTNIPPPPTIEQKEPSIDAPTKIENIKPVEPSKIHDPIKLDTEKLSPPPTLEQVVPKTLPVDVNPPVVPPPPIKNDLAKNDEIKKEKSPKKHKKDKTTKKDKHRKRKHDEISGALPPVLEASVSQEPVIAEPVTAAEPDLPKEPISAVIQPVDKPPTSSGSTGGVRLKIRIGSTLSSDSMKSSPIETTSSKPPSAGITPPPLATEEEKEQKLTEAPLPNADSDEPPTKKLKKKKHKKERNFATEAEKAEYEKQRKERKEKKRQEKSNGNSDDASKSDPQPAASEQEKSVHEPLKFKLNKNGGLEKQASVEKEHQIKDILSMSIGKEESKKKTESKEKDKSMKKHKKHKKERESRPTSSHSHVADSTEKSKPKEAPKMLNQFARPASQNSTMPKLFDPTPFRPEVKKHSTPKPAKSDANASSTSSTSSKSKKKRDKGSDDVWVCPVCSIAYVEGATEMIGCDNCNNWFHFHCVGMLKEPPANEDWFCQKCVEAKRKKAKNRKK